MPLTPAQIDELDAAAKALVATAPPMTDEQMERVRFLLRPAAQRRKAAAV